MPQTVWVGGMRAIANWEFSQNIDIEGGETYYIFTASNLIPERISFIPAS